MGLLELIKTAQECKYIQPNKPFQQLTDDEIVYHGLSDTLKNEIQVYGAIITCRKYSLLKIIVKNILKDYIKLYSKT